MILISLSVFFCWLIVREIRNPLGKFDSFSIGYILILAALAGASAYPPYKTWRLETMLSEKASIIAERPNVKVRCNSMFESLFSGSVAVRSVAGTAYIDTGEIFFESGWCKKFMAYLDNPRDPDYEILFAMHVFTHEVMHIRGERNEQKTDCQAIQRNHLVGDLLGIDREVSMKNAKNYYSNFYPRHPYFHRSCKPGGKLDEKLPDSIW